MSAAVAGYWSEAPSIIALATTQSRAREYDRIRVARLRRAQTVDSVARFLTLLPGRRVTGLDLRPVKRSVK